MKPRIGIYLSEGAAARLAQAAARPGATKSALVEAALDRLLGSDDDVSDAATLARQLSAMSGQLEQLDRQPAQMAVAQLVQNWGKRGNVWECLSNFLVPMMLLFQCLKRKPGKEKTRNIFHLYKYWDLISWQKDEQQ